MLSAVPSLEATLLASESEPETRSARSLAVVTEAPSTVCSICRASAPTRPELVARTYTVFTRPTRSEAFWSCESLMYRSELVPPSGVFASPTIV